MGPSRKRHGRRRHGGSREVSPSLTIPHHRPTIETDRRPHRQKLKKLKAAAKTQFGEPTSTDGAPPKTPAKRGLSKAVTETPAKPRSAAGKRKAKEVERNTEEDDEDKAPAKKVKSEVEGGNGDD